VLEIEESKNRCHFLAFKTREDAEEFLKENTDELFDAEPTTALFAMLLTS
jgi:hypothetical protein